MSIPPQFLDLICSGDSLTMGNHTPDKNGWRKPVTDGLTALGYQHTMQGRIEGDGNGGGTLLFPWNRHEGYGSNTIGDLIPRIPGAPVCNMVTAHVGTVDVALGNSLNTMLTNLVTYLDAWFAKGIFGLNLCQIIPQYPPSGGSLALLQAYNAAMPAIVEAKRREGKRIGLTDCYTGFDPAWLVPDGVHVTVQPGSNFMGARILQGIINVWNMDLTPPSKLAVFWSPERA